MRLIKGIRTYALKIALLISVLSLFISSSALQAQESCAPTTGHSSIDAACCVDPLTLSYANSNHEAYLSCVSQEILGLRLQGELSDMDASSLIQAADASGVNQ